MPPNSERPDKFVIDRALLKAFMKGQLDAAVELQVAEYLERHPQLLQKAAAVSGDGFLQRVKDIKQQSVLRGDVFVKATGIFPSIEDSKKALVSTDSIEIARTLEPFKAVETDYEVKKPAKSLVLPNELANNLSYQVHKELGRGGMGVVYLARNVSMDRLEVLKVLNERLLEHVGAKERFLREIRAVAKLSHPNIVTSYTVLSLGNLLVFVMEYVHGQNLHEFILKNKALPIGLACSFARQLAAGLQHAHERGLVHRDIKPSNVMVFKSDGQLQLKILDFGLAKATSEKSTSGLTQDGTMLGTPEYMAPEQLLNAAKADIRADVYGLGCTLYHMLIGRAPFAGTQGEIMMAHSQREPKALILERPEVPLELAAVVAKMMAKQPEKRYQVPADVITDLAPFLGRSRKWGRQSLSGSVSNTVTDLAAPSRDTSVEESAPHMLLTPEQEVLLPTSQRQQQAGRLSWVKHYWPILIPAVLTLLFGYYWLGGFLRSRNGSVTDRSVVARDGEQQAAVRQIDKESRTTNSAKVQASFLPLFNGRDFTGWKFDSKVAQTWKITNGELVGSGRHAGLETIRDDYRNFEIDAEISLRNVNSGLIFGGKNGFECELCIPTSLYMPALGGILLNGDKTGRLSPSVLNRIIVQPNTWVRLQLRCLNEWISVVINDSQVIDGSVGTTSTPATIRLEQWSDTGSIAIRKLLIRELP